MDLLCSKVKCVFFILLMPWERRNFATNLCLRVNDWHQTLNCIVIIKRINERGCTSPEHVASFSFIPDNVLKQVEWRIVTCKMFLNSQKTILFFPSVTYNCNRKRQQTMSICCNWKLLNLFECVFFV